MGRKVKKTESSRNIRPLKTAKEINAMKRALQFGTGTVTGQNRNGLRNAMIFVFGINTGLRISDIVKGQSLRHWRRGMVQPGWNQDPQEPACLYWQYQPGLGKLHWPDAAEAKVTGSSLLEKGRGILKESHSIKIWSEPPGSARLILIQLVPTL